MTVQQLARRRWPRRGSSDAEMAASRDHAESVLVGLILAREDQEDGALAEADDRDIQRHHKSARARLRRGALAPLWPRRSGMFEAFASAGCGGGAPSECASLAGASVLVAPPPS